MHLHRRLLQRAQRESLVTGMTIDPPTSSNSSETRCEPCLAGKMHAHPFPSTGTVTPEVLDLIHSDLVAQNVDVALDLRLLYEASGSLQSERAPYSH